MSESQVTSKLLLVRELIVGRDGLEGLLARCVFLSVVIATTSASLAFALGQLEWFGEVSPVILFGVAFSIWLAMVLGLVASEYPRGNQFALARIGASTFLRTGGPLLVVLLLMSYAPQPRRVVLFLSLLYAIGFGLSLLLELSRNRSAATSGVGKTG